MNHPDYVQKMIADAYRDIAYEKKTQWVYDNLCNFAGCERKVGYRTPNIPGRCEGHDVDEFGVMGEDCWCYQSPVDNNDADICTDHWKAMR